MSQLLFESKSLEFQHIHYPDFRIYETEMTFLTGPSGSGKTTLFKLLNGTLTPTSGTLLFRSSPLSEIPTSDLRKEILLVGQSAFLFDGTIFQNYAEYYRYLGCSTPSRDSILRYLEVCCAPFLPEQDCLNLSGGERHRVFASIYLSLHPRVLLLDEPTGALDHDNSLCFIKSLRSYCSENGITPILISHDSGLLETFGSQVLFIGQKNER